MSPACRFALLLIPWAVWGAEILDRLAVVVGNTAITESEVVQHVRLTAFLNGETPELSPAGKRRAAERLVEQELIRREISLTRYAEAGDGGVDSTLNDLRSRYPRPEQYQQALVDYGITEDELRAHLIWQMTVLRFTEFRFRTGNVDQQMDAWLKEARTRTPVEFRDEVFQ